MTSAAAPQVWQLLVLEHLATVGLRAACWLRVSTVVDGGEADSPASAADWSLDRLPVISERDFRQVRVRGLDFILSFAPQALAQELTRAARLGVWQFCFGDWLRYRGESGGFWEIYDGASVSSASLVQLQDDPDAVRVLRQGHMRTHPFSPIRNLAQLQAACVRWPAQLCLELLDGVADCMQGALVRCDGAAPRALDWPSRAALLFVRVARAIRAQFEILLVHEQWNIGVIDAPITSLLEQVARPPVRWLCAPADSEFFADPFGVMRHGRLTVLCEHLDYHVGRGVIVSVTPGDETPVSPVVLTPKPAVHLSYPFLLEHEGRLYCVPETHEAREVGLYELQRFPQEWKRIATLVSGAPLIDATVCAYQGRWWLFATLPAAKGANAELHLWYADSLAGTWQPHRGNPVKIDVRSARPAGTPFVKDGVLYRPAQDCSRAYGGRVIINRVHTLDARSFREEPVATVEPLSFAPYDDGVHTVSSVGELTLVDARRRRFVLAEFKRRLLGLLYGRSSNSSMPVALAPVASNGLRILWLIETFYPPLVGGAELLAASLTAGLAERGAAVQVITRQTVPPCAPDEQVGRVRVQRLEPAGILKGKGWRALVSIVDFLSRLLVALIRSADSFDVVIISGMKVMPLLVVPLCRILGKRCIVRIESSVELREAISSESLGEMHPWASGALLGFVQYLRGAALRRADRVVVISHEILAGLAEIDLDASRIVQIPNAVDLRKFRPAESTSEKERLRLQHGLPTDRTLALFVGRLSRAKGLPMLVQAWPDVLARHPELHLVIVGSGRHSFDDCEDELKAAVRAYRLEAHVQFVPENDRVHEYLQAADLFIFPSEYEGQSLGLIEALGSALVAVVTAVGAAPQLIKDGVSGFLFPPRDRQRMIAALERALAERDRWSSIGTAARAAATPYDLAAITLRLEGLCREVLTAPSTRDRS